MRKKNIFCLICFVMLLLVVPVNVVWAGDVGGGGDTTEHSHSWSYSADKNIITAKCTVEGDCVYKEGLTLTLQAKNMTYTGNIYEGVSVDN
ncbi:MAG: hypothetical protein HFH00_02855, partial [Dorea sp.]|nr:hypothetical protein [Dorea sp.]